MQTDVAIVISGVVAGAVEILKRLGIDGKLGMIWALALSVFAVALYGVSFEPTFGRGLIWPYFTAMVTVAAAAIGIHSGTKNTVEAVRSRNGSDPPAVDPGRFIAPAILLALLGLSASGCALKGAGTTTPTPDQVQQVRQTAVRIADATRTGLEIAQAAGPFIAALPVEAAVKDAYDCAVVRVTGTTTPRPKLLEVCGPSTPQGPGPLHRALESLKTVSTTVGLRTTVQEIVTWVTPLVSRLETSDQSSLRALGVGLRSAFAILGVYLAGGLT